MNPLKWIKREVKRRLTDVYHRKVLYEPTPDEQAAAARAREEANTAFIRAYLQTAGDPRLQLGCELHVLEGWLNTDIVPPPGRAARLDATRPFPLPDNHFRLVYSEHMIEHLPLEAGRRMLAECHRVLRPGGRLRIVTPNLESILGLYRPDPSPFQQRYLEWSANVLKGGAWPPEPVFVVNNFMRDWGHQFVYDGPVLRRCLEEAGFTGVTQPALMESPEPSLRGLEHAARMPEGFLAFESLVFEAVKEGSGS